jgi:xanthine/CO dehydrogenase XdhC/CoxF family maturation factor
MRDILDGLIAWRARGERFALATVIKTLNSAPRPPGATMAVSAAGEVLGSISGGCVEAETYELALQVVQTGHAQLARFGVNDDDAFAAGLTCGGIIDVFVEPVSDEQYPRSTRSSTRSKATARPSSPPSPQGPPPDNTSRWTKPGLPHRRPNLNQTAACCTGWLTC